MQTDRHETAGKVSAEAGLSEELSSKISGTPRPSLPPGLTKQPYAVTRFTDLRREKGFTDLHYRVRNTARDKALGFVGDVLADLERADVPHRGAVTITLTPAEKGWTVHMEVPIGAQGQ